MVWLIISQSRYRGLWASFIKFICGIAFEINYSHHCTGKLFIPVKQVNDACEVPFVLWGCLWLPLGLILAGVMMTMNAFPSFRKKKNGHTLATIVIFVLENVCLLICTILGNATMLANDRTLEQRKHGGFSWKVKIPRYGPIVT